ncbi:hypothetical protein CMQ_7998 [Grosmannia clavigera kw1407]|uniref:HMG box domain-containing protein n=1 Tax=Grosmannia clavigera (strain kw1407 / UAMH 11150) TaxID=655863 RepID=F0XS71_GROCL|nr:uncharacterized protein CMQ_7998 [Grosmannia clavigera kw1407]EFW99630.1 hypothetical protein CMQ_7998 [Grosmannia clavigera kw1407]
MAPPSSAQSLPPSVEEAYRRKCGLLKQRMADVEETNDAVRVRLARLKRQVEKQRLERAFLLEQLAKRTSANVEDSDGSPSPPPTPKDKPLRTKRGHRKASLTGIGGEPGSTATTFINQNLQAQSPNSDAASNHVDSQTLETQGSAKSGGKGKDKVKDKNSKVDGGDKDKDGANGMAKGPLKRPVNGFELYCAEVRPGLAEKKQEKAKMGGGDEADDVDMEDAVEYGAGSSSIEADLARGWTDMPQSHKDEFEARAAEELAKHKKAKEDARQQKQKDKGDDTEKEGEHNAETEDAKAGEEKKESAKRVVKEEDTEMADENAAPSIDSKE